MQPLFMGEILMFGGNFAPRGSVFCNGQLLAISTYSALFSLLGTTYGGDGRTTFGVPDLRSRIPLQFGSGPGLSPRLQGQKGGSETHAISAANMPQLPVSMPAIDQPGDTNSPSGNILSKDAEKYKTGSAETEMGAGTAGGSGGSVAVNHMPPFQVINYILATEGSYPTRS